MVGLVRSMWYYESRLDDDDVMRKLLELSDRYPNRGFDYYFGRIRNDGLIWNRKRVLRVYRKMGLTHRKKVKRRVPKREKQPLFQPVRANRMWSMDFMSDALDTGRKVRLLNIIDDFNREALCIDPAFSYPAEHVVRTLEILASERGLPEVIRADNGPEFIAHALKDYCEENSI